MYSGSVSVSARVYSLSATRGTVLLVHVMAEVV